MLFIIINNRVGRYQGCLAYLTFLGFEKNGEQLVVNPANEHARKTHRALSVMRMLLKEKTPPQDELEILALGPVERKTACFEFDSKASLAGEDHHTSRHQHQWNVSIIICICICPQ